MIKFQKREYIQSNAAFGIYSSNCYIWVRPWILIIFRHTVVEEGDLEFNIGEIIIITRNISDAWCFGYKENNPIVQGNVASCFVKVLNETDEFKGLELKKFKIYKALFP